MKTLSLKILKILNDSEISENESSDHDFANLETNDETVDEVVMTMIYGTIKSMEELAGFCIN